MSTKTCKKCGVEKPINDFTAKHNTCKLCILGPCKVRDRPPVKHYDTAKKVNEYVNYMTNDLNGNDY